MGAGEQANNTRAVCRANACTHLEFVDQAVPHATGERIARALCLHEHACVREKVVEIDHIGPRLQPRIRRHSHRQALVAVEIS